MKQFEQAVPEPICHAHVAANAEVTSEFFHILARYFHETRGSLNILTVDSYSQNLPLICCMYA